MILLFSLPAGGEFIIMLVLGLLLTKIFYVLALQSTLKAISIENRKMPARNVWLLLIPLFGTVWHFFIVSRLADSIKAEAISKNILIGEPRPAYNIGIAMCILNCLSVIPAINIYAAMASLICWILYWVKIIGFKNVLLNARTKLD
ncbi:MAG: hypothetical protein ABIN89_10255 [Chitinophagaceae bacterium]